MVHDPMGLEVLKTDLPNFQKGLAQWINRLREQVTSSGRGMAVHGRYGRSCPVCGSSVQRILHAENEFNYCPRCQTNVRILADRVLPRLLRDDWTRTVDELEHVPEYIQIRRVGRTPYWGTEVSSELGYSNLLRTIIRRETITRYCSTVLGYQRIQRLNVPYDE